MKKGLKKALGLLVALSLMVVGSAFSALAADSPEQRQTFSVDLNNFGNITFREGRSAGNSDT